jgi:hypothetical protein
VFVSIDCEVNSSCKPPVVREVAITVLDPKDIKGVPGYIAVGAFIALQEPENQMAIQLVVDDEDIGEDADMTGDGIWRMRISVTMQTGSQTVHSSNRKSRSQFLPLTLLLANCNPVLHVLFCVFNSSRRSICSGLRTSQSIGTCTSFCSDTHTARKQLQRMTCLRVLKIPCVAIKRQLHPLCS